MQLLLAPMEGVIDGDLRALLTGVGGYDACVTEFVRVSDRLLPPHIFLRHCPELAHGGRTAAGTPVWLQLLGGDPGAMGENAARAAELGVPAIDLNFGCPSKVVNRREGGAVLLTDPARVHAVVAAVRRAVPPSIPVTAKLRLGFEDAGLAVENACAAEAGGAARLTVHARTRADGYRVPARWEYLGAIAAAVRVPVVANGDIDSAAAYRRCRELSGLSDAMLGRGALARPDLALSIRNSVSGAGCAALEWEQVAVLVAELERRMALRCAPHRVLPRLKQWLRMLALAYPEAAVLFGRIRGDRDVQRAVALLEEAGGGPPGRVRAIP